MGFKKNFIKCMEYGKYLAFVLATIFVVISQFVGGKVWITLALALYTVAYGFMFATLVIHAVEIFNAGYQAKDMSAVVATPSEEKTETVTIEEGELKGKKVELINLKSEKFWTIAGSIFFGLFTLFTFVVLVLY